MRVHWAHEGTFQLRYPLSTFAVIHLYDCLYRYLEVGIPTQLAGNNFIKLFLSMKLKEKPFKSCVMFASKLAYTRTKKKVW